MVNYRRWLEALGDVSAATVRQASNSARAIERIEVNRSIDAGDARTTVELPDPPASGYVARLAKQIAQPQFLTRHGATEDIKVELLGGVEEWSPPVVVLEQVGECIDFREDVSRGGRCTVPDKFQIDDWRQCRGIHRYGRHEVLGLHEARAAEREEVVRTTWQADGGGRFPMMREFGVDPITTLAGLDIHEIDHARACDVRPSNLALVVRDVDAADGKALARGRYEPDDPEVAECKEHHQCEPCDARCRDPASNLCDDMSSVGEVMCQNWVAHFRPDIVAIVVWRRGALHGIGRAEVILGRDDLACPVGAIVVQG